MSVTAIRNKYLATQDPSSILSVVMGRYGGSILAGRMATFAGRKGGVRVRGTPRGQENAGQRQGGKAVRPDVVEHQGHQRRDADRRGKANRQAGLLVGNVDRVVVRDTVDQFIVRIDSGQSRLLVNRDGESLALVCELLLLDIERLRL